MRSRAEILGYQIQYYRDCMLSDPEGMRRKWREAKRKRAAMQLYETSVQLKATDSTSFMPAPVARNAGSGRGSQ